MFLRGRDSPMQTMREVLPECAIDATLKSGFQLLSISLFEAFSLSIGINWQQCQNFIIEMEEMTCD